MRRPCLDTPEQLWISDFPVASHGGHQGAHGKFPWTDALARRAITMRESGDTWREVVLTLEAMTQVKISQGAVMEHIEKYYGE